MQRIPICISNFLGCPPSNLISGDVLQKSDAHSAASLDLAGSGLGVLTAQCLNCRIADKQTLTDEIAASERHRNAKHAKANWHFTTADARIKLKHLYPSLCMKRATGPGGESGRWPRRGEVKSAASGGSKSAVIACGHREARSGSCSRASIAF